MIEDFVYDELNRLDVLTHYALDATPDDLSDNDKLAEFDYEVRADGKRTGVTETYWLDSDENGTPGKEKGTVFFVLLFAPAGDLAGTELKKDPRPLWNIWATLILHVYID